uniref:hypothetical protein n=1 Tax=Gelidibacter sp. TaxID=2018083 RepID=UPI00404AEAEA
SNKDVYRTLENITSAISMINEITRGKKVPLLILSTFEPEGDVDALDYLFRYIYFTGILWVSGGQNSDKKHLDALGVYCDGFDCHRQFHHSIFNSK